MGGTNQMPEAGMAANVQFTNRITGVLETMAEVDEAICAHLSIPVDEKEYAHHWFYSVGLLFATEYRGVELRDEIREWWADDGDRMDALVEIAKFLEENYHIYSFTTVGKASHV